MRRQKKSLVENLFKKNTDTLCDIVVSLISHISRNIIIAALIELKKIHLIGANLIAD